jgi:lathosterol oxidase
MIIDILFWIVSCIVSYDIWFYISHIILHQSDCYKAIHKEHHAVDYKKMNYMDTYVSHFIEGPFQGIGIIIPFLFIDFNLYVFLYSLIIVNIRGMLRHDVRYIWLIGNHHILHHKYPQYNFGEYWLDTLFDTRCPIVSEYKKGLIYL